MPRAPKSCNTLGCLEDAEPRHSHCLEHMRAKRRSAPLSPTAVEAGKTVERRRRKAVVQAWVREHGYMCPGWERPPHASDDLTAAHSTPVAHGGANSELAVLCRSCNSRQGVTST